MQFCDLAEACPGTTRLDGRTLEIPGASFAEVYEGFLACLRLWSARAEAVGAAALRAGVGARELAAPPRAVVR